VLSLHVKLVTAVSTASNSVDICNIQLSLITIITIKQSLHKDVIQLWTSEWRQDAQVCHNISEPYVGYECVSENYYF